MQVGSSRAKALSGRQNAGQAHFTPAPRFSIASASDQRHPPVPSAASANRPLVRKHQEASTSNVDSLQPDPGSDHGDVETIESLSERDVSDHEPPLEERDGATPPAKRRRVTPPVSSETDESISSASSGEVDRRYPRPPSPNQGSSPSPRPIPRLKMRAASPKFNTPRIRVASPKFSTPRVRLSHAASHAIASPQPKAPRFVMPHSHPASPGMPARPNFILPPSESHVAASAASGPSQGALAALLLSPRKRGQKFVAGGLAETVRGWALDVATSIPLGAGRERRPPDQLDRSIARLELREPAVGLGIGWCLARHAKSERPGAVSGEEADRSHEHWILIRQPLKGPSSGFRRRRNSGRNDLGANSSIAIRPPVWDVNIAGRTWRVAPQWDLLNQD